jgi:hypothetical protein
MEKRIGEMAQGSVYREKVQKLGTFRRIDNLTALVLVCETGLQGFPQGQGTRVLPGVGTE